MNYLMPDEGVLPMHSSVNVGQDGDSVVFFGLSGTGKTTLSADPERSLIGDDEHGWGDDGLFNFEGGCYAKTIRLSPMYEPDIFQTTRRFGTVLENVDLDPRTRELDLDSERFTENTRGAYPLEFIGNADPTGMTGQPRNGRPADRRCVRRPAADRPADPCPGRLPLHQRLHREAGGDRGRRQGAQATFSACFGAPFMPRHPGEYAAMLTERLAAHDVTVWLVNTGWTGGPYGIGERMNIDHTRAMVRAALAGRLGDVPMRLDPIFRVEVPLECPGRAGRVPGPARDLGRTPTAYDRRLERSRRCSPRTSGPMPTASARRVRDAGPRTTPEDVGVSLRPRHERLGRRLGERGVAGRVRPPVRRVSRAGRRRGPAGTRPQSGSVRRLKRQRDREQDDGRAGRRG